jgi:hypothetical protein
LGWQGLVGRHVTAPGAPPPSQGLVGATPPATATPVPGQGAAAGGIGQPPYGQGPYGQGGYGPSTAGAGSPYANYQQLEKKKSPVGWWIAGAALVLVIVVIAVIAIRAVVGGTVEVGGGPGAGPASQNACPAERSQSADPTRIQRRSGARGPDLLPDPGLPVGGAAAGQPGALRQ